jgi:hypothetical protein
VCGCCVYVAGGAGAFRAGAFNVGRCRFRGSGGQSPSGHCGSPRGCGGGPAGPGRHGPESAADSSIRKYSLLWQPTILISERCRQLCLPRSGDRNRRKRQRRVELATANVRRSELEQQLQRQQIASRVSLAYWVAAGAARTRDLLKQEVASFERVVQFHRDRAREGTCPRSRSSAHRSGTEYPWHTATKRRALSILQISRPWPDVAELFARTLPPLAMQVG